MMTDTILTVHVEESAWCCSVVTGTLMYNLASMMGLYLSPIYFDHCSPALWSSFLNFIGKTMQCNELVPLFVFVCLFFCSFFFFFSLSLLITYRKCNHLSWIRIRQSWSWSQCGTLTAIQFWYNRQRHSKRCPALHVDVIFECLPIVLWWGTPINCSSMLPL